MSRQLVSLNFTNCDNGSNCCVEVIVATSGSFAEFLLITTGRLFIMKTRAPLISNKRVCVNDFEEFVRRRYAITLRLLPTMCVGVRCNNNGSAMQYCPLRTLLLMQSCPGLSDSVQHEYSRIPTAEYFPCHS